MTNRMYLSMGMAWACYNILFEFQRCVIVTTWKRSKHVRSYVYKKRMIWISIS